MQIKQLQSRITCTHTHTGSRKQDINVKVSNNGSGFQLNFKVKIYLKPLKYDVKPFRLS